MVFYFIVIHISCVLRLFKLRLIGARLASGLGACSKREVGRRARLLGKGALRLLPNVLRLVTAAMIYY